MLTRRRFFAGAAAAPFAIRMARGQNAPLKARVKIDTERVIGDI